MQHLETLKAMRSELQERIDALDYTIHLLERLSDDTSDAEEKYTAEIPAALKGKTKGGTSFESAIDFTKYAEPEGPWTCKKCGMVNPVGTTKCMECKTKKS